MSACPAALTPWLYVMDSAAGAAAAPRSRLGALSSEWLPAIFFLGFLSQVCE